MATPLLLYKFNEASSGTAPTNVLDTSSGTALNLPVTYGTSSWTLITAGRGLTFGGTCGAISGSLSGTKVNTALAGATRATIEVVVDTTSAANFTEIFGLQSSAFDELFVIVTGGATGQVVVTGPSGTSVAFDCPVGRHHLMAVLDTTQATAANRILLYVDGVLATVNTSPTTPTYPAQNTAIDVGFTWANLRIIAGCLTSAGTQAFTGPLFEALMYASALTSTDASAHSTSMLANNDVDPNAATGLSAWLDMTSGSDLARTMAALSYARATSVVREQWQPWFSPPSVARRPSFESERDLRREPAEARPPVRSGQNEQWSSRATTKSAAAWSAGTPCVGLAARPPAPRWPWSDLIVMSARSAVASFVHEFYPRTKAAPAVPLGEPWASKVLVTAAPQIAFGTPVTTQPPSGGTGGTTSVSVDLTVQAGSTILVCADSAGIGVPAGTMAVSDNVNGVYTLLQTLSENTLGFALTGLYAFVGTAAGTLTITATWSVSGNYPAIHAVEIVNAKPVGSIDGSSAQSQTLGAGATADSGTFTSANQPALIVGIALNDSGTTPTVAGGGATAVPVAGTVPACWSWQRATSAGAQDATFTTTDFGGHLTFGVAVDEAGGGPGLLPWADDQMLSTPPCRLQPTGIEPWVPTASRLPPLPALSAAAPSAVVGQRAGEALVPGALRPLGAWPAEAQDRRPAQAPARAGQEVAVLRGISALANWLVDPQIPSRARAATMPAYESLAGAPMASPFVAAPWADFADAILRVIANAVVRPSIRPASVEAHRTARGWADLTDGARPGGRLLQRAQVDPWTPRAATGPVVSASAAPLAVDPIRRSTPVRLMVSEAWTPPPTPGSSGDSSWGGWGGDWGGDWGGGFDPPTFTPGPWHDLVSQPVVAQVVARAQEAFSLSPLVVRPTPLSDTQPRQPVASPARAAADAWAARPLGLSWHEAVPPRQSVMPPTPRGQETMTPRPLAPLATWIAELPDRVHRVLPMPTLFELFMGKPAAPLPLAPWADLAQPTPPPVIRPARAGEGVTLASALRAWFEAPAAPPCAPSAGRTPASEWSLRTPPPPPSSFESAPQSRPAAQPVTRAQEGASLGARLAWLDLHGGVPRPRPTAGIRPPAEDGIRGSTVTSAAPWSVGGLARSFVARARVFIPDERPPSPNTTRGPFDDPPLMRPKVFASRPRGEEMLPPRATPLPPWQGDDYTWRPFFTSRWIPWLSSEGEFLAAAGSPRFVRLVMRIGQRVAALSRTAANKGPFPAASNSSGRLVMGPGQRVTSKTSDPEE